MNERVIARSNMTHMKFDLKDRRKEDEDAHAIAEKLRERYKKPGISAGALTQATPVSRSVLLPSVNDPKLWLVRCKV